MTNQHCKGHARANYSRRSPLQRMPTIQGGGGDRNVKSKCFVCDLFGGPADIHDENESEWIIENRDSQEFELNHQGKMTQILLTSC